MNSQFHFNPYLSFKPTVPAAAVKIITVEDITKAVSSSLNPILSLLPTLVRMMQHHYNPFNGGSSKGTRFKEFRNELRKAVCGESLAPVCCMVTGIVVSEENDVLDDDIVASHILPSSTTEEIAAFLEMSLGDIQSPKNGIFLSKNIEVSFDILQLSFVPIDHMNPTTFKMVIWKEECRKKSVFRDREEKIGDYDGIELKLGNFEPFRRALSFQALTAYNFLSPADKETFRAKKQLYEVALEETLMTSIKEEGPDSDDEL